MLLFYFNAQQRAVIADEAKAVFHALITAAE